MVLILDHVEVDEIAQIRAGIPADVVGVHVDLAKLFDHFHLICSINFGPRGGGCQVRRRVLVVMMIIGRGNVNGGKRERVRDLQVGLDVHTDQKTGRGCGKGLSAMFYYFHDHLALVQWCNAIFAYRPGLRGPPLGPL